MFHSVMAVVAAEDDGHTMLQNNSITPQPLTKYGRPEPSPIEESTPSSTHHDHHSSFDSTWQWENIDCGYVLM
uniref:Uncharacterized protein n=1 Tax=Pristionchus pacificus TaxID=54126 RepID=A0A2A6BQ98_PRIPA|eukprot:PDM68122.1 hypothetical protein PRIPAC_46166 [Pristionchus pacificus]